ncbi:hypothetical protein I3760_06G073200 [Carya illinoinensis]|nr:hypothetical protein I3760_06G073200 [Carya illinoinensis]
MECLKLIASAEDLNHANQYIVGLALFALGNICSAEMARDLAPEVERLLQFRDPNTRKKSESFAALCAIRIIKKVPDLVENFINPAAARSEKHHGVLITGVQLCTDLCKVSPEALEHFRKKCTVRTLRDVVNSPYAAEYDIAGITDPFLHIRFVRLLCVLGQGVATKTESNKNAGNAILYECVETIMSIEDNGGLRVLSINILGRFLYVALNMLMKAITVDSQAVQQHRATILECVKDSDASIRKRALELVHLLVNESNVKLLTKVLIEYLEVSDQEFKGDLTAKIFVDRYSIWYIDQMLKVLSEAGNFVKDEAWHALIVVISNASDLHGYSVKALYRAFQTSAEQEIVWCIEEYGEMLINNVGLLDIENPITASSTSSIAIPHTSDLTAKSMSLIALLKLSSRFPSCSERIRDLIIQNRGSLVLELQQRSIEFNSVIEKHQNIRSALVGRMPVLDEATFIGRRASSSPAMVSTSNSASLNLPNGVAKPPAAPLVDLLDLSSDDVPAPSSSWCQRHRDEHGAIILHAISGTNEAPRTGTDILLDLLSIETPPAQSSSITDILSSSQGDKSPVASLEEISSLPSLSTRATSAGATSMMDLLDGFAPNPPMPEDNGPVYPSIVAFESSSLRITFDFSKAPGNPQTTAILATFTNLSQNIYTDFIFQAAAPKFLQLHLDPASSNTLPANGNDP